MATATTAAPGEAQVLLERRMGCSSPAEHLGFPGLRDCLSSGGQTAPASVQEAAFAKLYAEAGTSPWEPYDG